MPLIKNAVSSLTQGVSQQAESQRFPSQATEQINAYSSPIKGLVKRPPTKFINRVEADTTGKAFVHTINRDSSEQYTVVVNPYTAVTVADFNVGTDTVEITTSDGEELAVNTAIRFTMTTESGRFPKGIEANTTYYVKTSAASGSNFNITLSKTKGGALVRIGKVQVDGIKIVSVREKATKQWVDGVYEITFAANHGFSAGDIITIDNLAGKAITMLGETTKYELRVPDNYDYHYTYSNSEGYEVKAWDANKFLLGIPNKGRTLDQNLGYATDTETLAGWNQIGDNDLHWTALDATTAANTSHNKCATLRWNADDSFPTGWDSSKLVGSLIRLGNRRNKSKTHRAIVTGHNASDRTITLESIVDLEDEFFDSDLYDNSGNLITTYNTSSNPKWVFVAIWGDTSSSAYNEGSNPRQFKESGTPKETADATVGSDTAVGTFRGETGGISIYDNATGAQQTLNIDSGLEYLTAGNDPNKNLKAVTVADYTFLVNKSVPTRARSDTKYEKRYEAIITAKTADYGKRYKVKVGTAASPIEVVADGGSNTVAYVDIKGRNKELENEKWIARIQSKSTDPKFNGREIRIVQHWDWNHYKTTVNQYKLPQYTTEAERNSYGYTDFLPSMNLLGNQLPIPLPNYFYYNERIAAHYTGQELTIYGNFHWANNSYVTDRLTTVQDLIDLFANTPELAAEWEVKTLTGTATSTTPTVAGDDTAAAGYTFDKCIVGKEGRLYDHEGHKYRFGRNESISADWGVAAGGFVFQSQYRGSGYLSPSAVPDEKFERKYFTSHAGRTLVGASWDSTDTTSPSIHKIETGEYWYKTPKWTGDEHQVATGTEKIAEMLASSARIVGGKWDNVEPLKANGRPLTEKAAGATGAGYTGSTAAKGAEECFGLSYQGPNNNQGYLHDINAAGSNKILGEHEGNWQVQQQGYTIALLAPDREQFQISVEDDFGGRGLSLTYFEVGESADLPAVARHGHIVKVIGDAREEADDYYLRFEGDDPNEFSTLQHGRWQECVGYEQRYLLDSATMPVGLVRESDGTFTLKQLEWDERKAGDDITNPFPSFVGNTISDIFLFRNRLGFLSGENIIFSEAGEYFNFFRTTVAALVDSAPIDIAASTNKVSTLHSAVPYNERLILFSDQTQFTLDADPFLSVRHVTLTPSNEIDNIPDATPVVSGDAIFYGFSRTGYSGVGQLNVSSSDADLIESGDATGHIPKYIKGNITKLAAATNEDVICCITDDTTSASLYVHKYMVNEQNQKIQAAWFKYQFGTTNDFIADISFLGNTLYMVVKRGSEMFLESLVFEDELKTAGMDYEVLLDQRIDNLGISVSGSTTTVTLPTDTAYTMTSAHRVVTEDSAILTPSNITATTFDLPVNLTGKKFFIGIPYTMEYTFSQPFLKSQKVTETGRYQLHRGILQYANSRSFTLDVIHNAHIATEFQTTNTNTFTTDSVQNLLEGTAELQEGKFLFPIRERNDRLGMVLKNTSPYPADFLSIDYEARVFSRGSRWSS